MGQESNKLIPYGPTSLTLPSSFLQNTGLPTVALHSYELKAAVPGQLSGKSLM